MMKNKIHHWDILNSKHLVYTKKLHASRLSELSSGWKPCGEDEIVEEGSSCEVCSKMQGIASEMWEKFAG